MKLKKKLIMKKKPTQINLSNSEFRLWDRDNFIKKQIKKSYEAYFSTNSKLKYEIKKIN